MSKIKILVIDDSAVIRQVMTEIINGDSRLELDAAVSDPIFAMKRMEVNWPDVIVLDIEMPRMDGITFLKKIMSERPTPVVMCSTLTGTGTKMAITAMAAGAIDIVTKPKLGVKAYLLEENKYIINVIKSAAEAKNLDNLKLLSRLSKKVTGSVTENNATTVRVNKVKPIKGIEKIVVIGASTGGTQAIEAVLTSLPKSSPGIIIVQHMPEKFTASFSERLNNECNVEVREAKDNDAVSSGVVLIAPGNMHLTLRFTGNNYFVNVKDGPLVNRHRPSVDVLFRSVARVAGKNILGIIMTGMGSDGARGLLEMRKAGSPTIGQSEASCIVYGMPNEASKLGAVENDVDLSDIAAKIISHYES